MKMKERLGHLVPVCIITIIYLFTFQYLEQRHVPIHIIQGKIDNMIPFCEYFIIPYLLWFLYVVTTVGYIVLFGADSKEFKQLCLTLLTGLIVFVMISYIFPNGHNLRPDLRGDNIFQILVMRLYQTDTPTNILPSLHVFHSVACCIALLKNSSVRKHSAISFGILILTVSIVLSTMFLKQHSIIDVVMALLMNLLCYCLFYNVQFTDLVKDRENHKGLNTGIRHKRKGIEL